MTDRVWEELMAGYCLGCDQDLAVCECAEACPACGARPGDCGCDDGDDPALPTVTVDTRGADVSGLCECGCGQPTNLAAKTSARKGWIKGQPLRFVHGHSGGGWRRGDGKLTREDIADIQRRAASGETVAQIADDYFEVTRNTIRWHINRGKR